MSEQAIGLVGVLIGVAAVVGVVFIPLGLRLWERAQAPSSLTLAEVSAAVSRLAPLSVTERGAALEPLNGRRVRWQAAYGSLMPTRGGSGLAGFTGRPNADLRFTVSVSRLQRGWIDQLRPGEPVVVEGTLRVAAAAPGVLLDNARVTRATPAQG